MARERSAARRERERAAFAERVLRPYLDSFDPSGRGLTVPLVVSLLRANGCGENVGLALDCLTDAVCARLLICDGEGRVRVAPDRP